MSDVIANMGSTAKVIISLAIMLFAGFLITRISKKLRLPNITGYIVAGILIGPYLLNLIPQEIIVGMDFVTDIALSYIAFGVGKYFKFSTLKKSGSKVLTITLFESLTAAIAVIFAMVYVFKLPMSFALLLGAIGCATAPASTIMTIRQYHAKGDFVNTVLQVVALDDAVSLFAFSICAAIAQSLNGQLALDYKVFLIPLVMNLLVVMLGILLGLLLNKLINNKRSKEHSLVLVNAVILSLTGFCAFFDISPLLGCMALGTAYINISGNKELFKRLNSFSPPILLLFFVISGMKLDVPSLATAGVIGVGYFFIRIIGKYAGSYIGAKVSKSSTEIKKYLGLALVPQAGVSIGLAALGQRLLPTELGTMLSTIILSSAVLYEMIGPACAKASLLLSGVITETEDNEPQNVEVDDNTSNNQSP